MVDLRKHDPRNVPDSEPLESVCRWRNARDKRKLNARAAFVRCLILAGTGDTLATYLITRVGL